ncbi:hypothetical protein SNEBB_004278 [Seison nebaliae]|nr:hypothetical protein SNEBB_004278 [Seison nebaliae]
MRNLLSILLCFVFVQSLWCLLDDPKKSVGEPWPLPQTYWKGENKLIISPERFRVRLSVGSYECATLLDGINRLYGTIFIPTDYVRSNYGLDGKYLKNKLTNYFSNMKNDGNNDGSVDLLEVNLKKECEYLPSLNMDESYQLNVKGNSGSLNSSSIWGILRGLMTFSQLVHSNFTTNELLINEVTIQDFPRFPHRGVLIDTARHFLSMKVLMKNIEALAQSKFNVFHWHIVDSQSFPYSSQTFPALSEKGAYNPTTHVYSPYDVQTVMEQCRLRGIRLVPEFDTPGHTDSWIGATPDFLTKCYSEGKPNGKYGPIDPSRDDNFQFLKSFFMEIYTIFLDDYVHLGGDEVSFACWESNPDIEEFMKKHSFGTDYSKLEQFYMEKLLSIIHNLPTTHDNFYIIWQDVIDNHVVVNNETIVQVWLGVWQEKLREITGKGYRTLLSSPWYLDHIHFGTDWTDYYKVEPLAFPGTSEQKKLVIGGEACLWGEFADNTNFVSRLWPRASAIAERLWSSKETTNLADAELRLNEHRCRLVKNGIGAETVSGPGFCQIEYEE